MKVEYPILTRRVSEGPISEVWSLAYAFGLGSRCSEKPLNCVMSPQREGVRVPTKIRDEF